MMIPFIPPPPLPILPIAHATPRPVPPIVLYSQAVPAVILIVGMIGVMIFAAFQYRKLKREEKEFYRKWAERAERNKPLRK
jgi:alkanesulfonate monooxygenase SsuD/methylene tetrahydromethanopterin reductase-like flavin-dependent oxidoreductase (luciferase family)